MSEEVLNVTYMCGDHDNLTYKEALTKLCPVHHKPVKDSELRKFKDYSPRDREPHNPVRLHDPPPQNQGGCC
jgi:hypothetical protein